MIQESIDKLIRKTLEEDISRRESPISAMALRPVSLAQGKASTFELIDKYGGQKDLEKKFEKGLYILGWDANKLEFFNSTRIVSVVEE